MLEKNTNFFYDSHFHYAICLEKDCFDVDFNWKGCSCAHSREEWNIQKENNQLIQAFGIHPQLIGENEPLLEDYLYLEEDLLKNNQITTVGEIGFDFFTEDFKKYSELQQKYFLAQLKLAVKYEKPVIVHCRKANEKLFEYSSELKKLPGVLFHSFMGTFIEAKSLINRGINCYFSFGKQMMNNNKKVIDCVKNLPIQNLLLETDGPFQFLKGQEKTYASEIKSVYECASKLRNEDLNYLCKSLEINFNSLFQK